MNLNFEDRKDEPNINWWNGIGNTYTIVYDEDRIKKLGRMSANYINKTSSWILLDLNIGSYPDKSINFYVWIDFVLFTTHYSFPIAAIKESNKEIILELYDKICSEIIDHITNKRWYKNNQDLLTIKAREKAII